MPLVTEELLSTLLHVTVYVYTQFAECTGTDCKWNGITKKKKKWSLRHETNEMMKEGQMCTEEFRAKHEITCHRGRIQDGRDG
jgi:hypothetical protein